MVRASSGLDVPPTPLAAVHPELGVILELTLRQFRRGWLSGAERVDIAITPPWGSGWLIPDGGLTGEELEEQVLWELQQRLSEPLEEHVYLWRRVPEGVYAVVVRPELIEFWEQLTKNNSIKINSLVLLPGLVDEEIEQSANLIPLLSVRDEQPVWSGAAEEVSDDEEPLDDDGMAGDLFSEDSEWSDEEEEAELEELLGSRKEFPSRKRRVRVMPWIAAAVLLAVVVGGGWMYRQQLQDVIAGLPFLRPDSALVQEQMPPDTLLTEPLAEAAEEETSEPVAEGAWTGDGSVESHDEKPPSRESAKPQVRQLPEYEAVGDPGEGQAWDAGLFLTSVLQLAENEGVTLPTLIFQGNQLRCKANGNPVARQEWSTRVTNEAANMSDGSAYRLKSGIFTLQLSLPDEQYMTRAQFDRFAGEMRLDRYGRHAYLASRDELNRFLRALSREGGRPWRLSANRLTSDRYVLTMLP